MLSAGTPVQLSISFRSSTTLSPPLESPSLTVWQRQHYNYKDQACSLTPIHLSSWVVKYICWPLPGQLYSETEQIPSGCWLDCGNTATWYRHSLVQASPQPMFLCHSNECFHIRSPPASKGVTGHRKSEQRSQKLWIKELSTTIDPWLMKYLNVHGVKQVVKCLPD